MSEQPQSFEQYLAGLPEERRADVQRVWQVVRDNMPNGYQEHIGPKFLSFNAEGESYVALANQKQYTSLYLIPVYTFPELDAKLEASGKKLKRGKSCINFKRSDDLPLDVIGDIIGATPPNEYLAHIRKIRNESAAERKARRSGA